MRVFRFQINDQLFFPIQFSYSGKYEDGLYLFETDKREDPNSVEALFLNRRNRLVIDIYQVVTAKKKRGKRTKRTMTSVWL